MLAATTASESRVPDYETRLTAHNAALSILNHVRSTSYDRFQFMLSLRPGQNVGHIVNMTRHHGCVTITPSEDNSSVTVLIDRTKSKPR